MRMSLDANSQDRGPFDDDVNDDTDRVDLDITVGDARAGQTVVEEKRVTERESYTPVVGESVRSARQEAVRTLAERVVHALESGF